MDLLAKAKAELADIDQRIAEMARRKNDLQAFIAAGERLFGAEAASIEDEPLPRRRLSRDIQELSQEVAGSIMGYRLTKKDRITSAAFETLLVRGVHMTSRELADVIGQQGIDLGNDPASTVSVLLSRDDRFKSERAKGGWKLASSPDKEETPQGAATPAGSDLLDFQTAPEQGTGPTPD
jgi:hypothetical protein